ncbi:MAG: alpha/beta fold hydrolase [Myxococcales bacterium]|nr:alpha/beta fold hydrolase [Myxococcales bacterium]
MNTTLRNVFVAFLVLLGTAVVFMVWALPDRQLLPTGSHGIATDAWIWTDQRIDELAQPPQPRRLPVQAWYPASGALGPVVVFVHGSQGRREAYLTLLRQLASDGYVAVAADHPPVAFMPNFPDASPPPPSPRWQELMAQLREPEEMVRTDTFQEAHRMVEADVRLILERLPEVLGVDVQQVALAGHSFGGSVVLSVCSSDPRCTAVIDLDGPPLGEPLPAPPSVPTLLITAGQTRLHPGMARLFTRMEPLMDASDGSALVVDVPDAGHLDLSDLPLLARPVLLRPVLGASQIGRGDVDRQLRGVAHTVVAFLDRHLRQQADADPVQVARDADFIVVSPP